MLTGDKRGDQPTVAEGNIVRRQDVALMQEGANPSGHPNGINYDKKEEVKE